MIGRQFQNLCGVMVYNIVDGPSKLEDKEKRFDYICEALNDNRALSEIDM